MTDITAKLALLPCPFCGGEAEIERIGDRRVSTVYRCCQCGCSLETGEEWGHGEHWNRRAALTAYTASQSEPDDALEGLRELSERATKGPWIAPNAQLFQLPVEPLDATTDDESVCLADFDMDTRVDHDSEGVANADLAARAVNYVRARLAAQAGER